MSDPRGRATVPFEEIQPGDSVGEFSYDVTPDLVDRHLRATQQEPYADPDCAPISLLAADGVNLADRFWDISQSVHAGQSLDVFAVPRIGDRLTVSGVAREKFVKRGRRYITSETNTVNQSGAAIARGLTTGVLVYAEGTDEREELRSRSAPTAMPSIIESLEPLVRDVTHEAMVLYEPPGEANIHTCDEVAREAGLPAAIATGTLFLAYVFDLLHRGYGPGSLVGTELEARIRLPVFAGDQIATTADVIERGDGRVLHTVRCEGPHGDVIVGRVRVRER